MVEPVNRSVQVKIQHFHTGGRYESISAALRLVRACHGAIAKFSTELLAPVHTGDSILVKPNMLSARRPEEAVTTHPAILKAVLLFLRDLKCHAMVADSPASGSFQRVAEKTGIKDVCEELNVPCFELDQPTTVCWSNLQEDKRGQKDLRS